MFVGAARKGTEPMLTPPGAATALLADVLHLSLGRL
jgi:hypothetical protein